MPSGADFNNSQFFTDSYSSSPEEELTLNIVDVKTCTNMIDNALKNKDFTTVREVIGKAINEFRWFVNYRSHLKDVILFFHHCIEVLHLTEDPQGKELALYLYKGMVSYFSQWKPDYMKCNEADSKLLRELYHKVMQQALVERGGIKFSLAAWAFQEACVMEIATEQTCALFIKIAAQYEGISGVSRPLKIAVELLTRKKKADVSGEDLKNMIVVLNAYLKAVNDSFGIFGTSLQIGDLESFMMISAPDSEILDIGMFEPMIERFSSMQPAQLEDMDKKKLSARCNDFFKEIGKVARFAVIDPIYPSILFEFATKLFKHCVRLKIASSQTYHEYIVAAYVNGNYGFAKQIFSQAVAHHQALPETYAFCMKAAKANQDHDQVRIIQKEATARGIRVLENRSSNKQSKKRTRVSRKVVPLALVSNNQSETRLNKSQ